MVIKVDLDECCCEWNHAKIHTAAFTEGTGRASRLKSFKCDHSFACSNICNYDKVIALTDLHN